MASADWGDVFDRFERAGHSPFDMSLPSFTQHLAVLEAAELVTSTKEGRVRTYRLAPAGLELADGWLAEQRRVWQRRLDRLDAFVLELKERS